MQSYNDSTSGFRYKSSIQKNTWKKGKENDSNAPCFQLEKQSPVLEKHGPQDTPKSRLPILSKVNQPPDFQKLHQSWQNQFQKGKAVKKKACTRPQPFNFSQKLDRPRVATDTQPSVSPPARHRREPLAEVTLGQKNQFNYDGKGGNAEFKADPAALASILSDVGVPVPATGKLSLAQRVPMRGSSIAQSSNLSKNMMVRSSMYAVLRSQSASSNLDRISCFSNMQPKVSDKKPPVFKQNPLLKCHVPDRNLEELVSSSLDGKLQSQENPVLQQMNRTASLQTSSMTSPPLRSQEVAAIKSTRLHPLTEDVKSSVLPADKYVFWPNCDFACGLQKRSGASTVSGENCCATVKFLDIIDSCMARVTYEFSLTAGIPTILKNGVLYLFFFLMKSSARSTVKWADERSPSMSESLCECGPKIDQVAVRLFLDGECPGESDKKTESAEESDRLKGSERLPVSAQKRKEATLPENRDGADVAARDLTVHANMHPHAPLSLVNTANPPVQYPSIVSCMKTSLPLSFLSHPVVQALQSNTLGSYSLPDIARLRIQAAVSAKQRFWETCLDEECAFYTSRGAASAFRNCIDPVSSFLEKQDDLHFTPIIPGDP
ncbi:tastin [Phyllobates terribilis]|uniref:tastin n=1 Tax=Phyllobates terribilis TaxID=111132 RepID=UPI003CCADAE8